MKRNVQTLLNKYAEALCYLYQFSVEEGSFVTYYSYTLTFTNLGSKPSLNDY